MRTSQAHRYARYAAAAAVSIALLAAGLYLWRSWQARVARLLTPPTVPASVEKSSQSFSYTKQEQDRAVFTVRASRATQFKQGNRAVLEDVWITIYGRTGGRADKIQTRSCDYQQDAGRFVCAGDVTMDFQSADRAGNAATAADGKIVHVETRGVTLEGDTGDASSDQLVRVRFPGGQGQAKGVRYRSKDNVIELLHNVKFALEPSALSGSPTALATGPLVVRGRSAEFARDSRVVLLHGPIDATEDRTAGHREVRAAELLVELDAAMHARRITARGLPAAPAELRDRTPANQVVITAEAFAADFAQGGWMESLRAEHGVRVEVESAGRREVIAAARAEAAMVPRYNVPSNVKAEGDVKMDAEGGGGSVSGTRHFETAQLTVSFVPSGPAVPNQKMEFHASHAETDSAALLSWTAAGMPGRSRPTPPAESKTTLAGQRFQMDFDAQNQLRQVNVHGSAKLEHRMADGSEQRTTSDDLAVSLDRQGQWSEVTEDGHVRMQDSGRNQDAQAAHLEMFRAEDAAAATERPAPARTVLPNQTTRQQRDPLAAALVRLSGGAEISDALSTTTADSVRFDQTTGEIRAEGHVLTTYGAEARPGAGAWMPKSALQLSRGNGQASVTHIAAGHLEANSESGKAIYSGRARLWQQGSSVEADSLDLEREPSQLLASGDVRATFVAHSAQSSSSEASRGTVSTRGQQTDRKGPAGHDSAKPELWQVRAASMRYRDTEATAHLEGGFSAESRDIAISGRTGDIYFSRSAGEAGAGQTVDRAVATGDVAVRQGQRHGSAERGEYQAPQGKVTLSGGNAKFYDDAGNAATGSELTFYLSDGTILIQSEKSSNPQAHPRVER